MTDALQPLDALRQQLRELVGVDTDDERVQDRAQPAVVGKEVHPGGGDARSCFEELSLRGHTLRSDQAGILEPSFNQAMLGQVVDGGQQLVVCAGEREIRLEVVTLRGVDLSETEKDDTLEFAIQLHGASDARRRTVVMDIPLLAVMEAQFSARRSLLPTGKL